MVEDDEWEYPVAMMEIIPAEDNDMKLSHDQSQASGRFLSTHQASVPSSPSVYSTDISFSSGFNGARDISIQFDSLDTNNIQGPNEGVEDVDAGFLGIDGRESAVEKAEKSATKIDELMFELFITCAGEDDAISEKGPQDPVQLALNVMAEGAYEELPVVFHDQEDTNNRRMIFSLSPTEPHLEVVASRSRKESDISLFRDHTFVVRRETKRLTEEDEKRLSRRRKGVTLLSPQDYERLESESSSHNGSFSIDRGAIVFDGPEEVEVVEVKAKSGPRKPQPGWI